MTDLNTLADRCEQLEGPCRDMDAEIHRAFGLAVVREGLRDDGQTDFVGPSYTASLDAAMQLVPEGWFWEYSSDRGEASVSGLAAGEFGYQRKRYFKGTPAQINTPALALCAAALRVRAMEDE